ncbi:sigma-54-dependent Fis family transcriptional regulator [Sphingomonas crocodyli]|uniref:DNA-binding transcriptional regulator NtrC n=1 Tax=Sphingomonas crocodyli TaxID=1979270 RepID=A0A437M900_9SPHN|nr:sigma-54-dependent Fis family transcriptional regulator [Sphingomonas crocodyli]
MGTLAKTAPARGLLLIDDQPAQGSLIAAMAGRANWRVSRAPDVNAALRIADSGRERIDAVLMDVWSPDADTAGAIAQMRRHWPHLPVVVMTAQDSARLAISAIRAGASDFVIKPIAPDRLLAALDHATTRGVDGELRPLAEKPQASLDFASMIGSAPCFRDLVESAMRVAPTPAPVLIEGESGVGKEVLAQAIHRASPLGAQPLVTVNCGAIPANLVESELFGHERGAFTGAFERRLGKFAIADGGTIFLDEIGDLPLDAQVKLLRVLQSGEIQPIGARMPRNVSVRVIAATNSKLAQAVSQGRFREDLFYRLAVVQLTMPPLRDRIEDLPALACGLLTRIAEQLGASRLGIDKGALDLLGAFDWPGNVRQLHNVLFRAAIFCRTGTLTRADFPHLARSTATGPAIAIADMPAIDAREPGPSIIDPFAADGHVRSIEAIEADMIRLAIHRYDGRMTEVARRLGIGRSTLYRKLAELGISA